MKRLSLRIFSLILCGALLLSSTACKKEDVNVEVSSNQNTASTESIVDAPSDVSSEESVQENPESDFDINIIYGKDEPTDDPGDDDHNNYESTEQTQSKKPNSTSKTSSKKPTSSTPSTPVDPDPPKKGVNMKFVQTLPEFNGNLESGDTVYYINEGSMTDPEKVMISSLQGILAQQGKPQIFIADGTGRNWMEFMKSDYGIKFEEMSNPWDLVKKFKGSLKDNGYVTWRNRETGETEDPQIDGSVNKACTIAGVERYLVVQDTLETKAKEAGLTKKIDSVEDFMYEIDVFHKYKDQLNKHALYQQMYNNTKLRDIGVATKSLYFYDFSIEDDYLEVLDWMETNGTIMGWYNDEVSGVEATSMKNLMTLASDHAYNFSVYSALKTEPVTQKPTVKYERSSTNVHYVSFTHSDGDNIQYQINAYYNSPTAFGSAKRGQIPFGWPVAPSLYNYAPNVVKYLYKNQSSNDNFVQSVSGAGYANPDLYDIDELRKFTGMTGDGMNKLDIGYARILMNTSEDELNGKVADIGTNTLNELLYEYARSPYIKGGFLYYGSRYMPTKYPGATYWIGNKGKEKPFVSCRETMWLQNNSSKSKEISEQAWRINHYPKDATKVEGYTAVNIHAWSYSYDDAVALTSMLGKDVVVVTPTEMMEIMKKNVKDKTTKIELDKPNIKNKDFDYSNIPQYKDYSYLDIDAINKKQATDQTAFDFNDGLQGWKLVSMGAEYDFAGLVQDNGMQVIKFDGSKFGDKVDPIPNGYMYNKITLPNVDNLKMKMYLKQNDVGSRVEVIDEDGTVTTVQPWVRRHSDSYVWWEIDMSQFKGKTVTVIYQNRDSDGLEGSLGGGSGENTFVSQIKFE